MWLHGYGVGGGYATTRPAHDNPTVTITAPTAGQTFTSGGPTFTFTWTYAQAQSVAQAFYRVVLNDGLADVYDSGWLAGAGLAHPVNWQTEGLNPDHDAFAATVYVQSADGFVYQGSAVQSFNVHWGVPSVTVTTPAAGAVLTSTALTAVWTYADTRSVAEGAHRVRVLDQAGATSLYDSAFVAGAATTYLIPFLLSDGSSYTLEVTARNTNGIESAAVLVAFSTVLVLAPDYPDELAVGTVYEVGVNGVGYMLFDGRPDQQDMVRHRSTTMLDPPRPLVTGGDAPFSDYLDRYSFEGHSDWRGGAGQKWSRRASSDTSRFWDSDGVNPFEPNQVSLLKATKAQITTAYAHVECVIASDLLFALTGAKQITSLTAPDSSTTPFNVAAATTITSLASDGKHWYAAAGAQGIFQGASAADPGAAWSAVQADLGVWAAQRLCVAYKGAGSATANTFSAVLQDGTEDSSATFALDKGWTITSITSGGGFVWFSAYQGDQGAIYKWNLTDPPSVAWQLPPGERARAVFWSQGQVAIRSDRVKNGSDTIATIWNAAVQSGDLIPSYVVELDLASTDDGPGAFGASGRFVFFSWAQTAAAGLGAIDLSSGSYARWIKSAGAGTVRSILNWRGHIFYTADSVGVWREDDIYVTSGTIELSLVDLGSTLDKVWDRATLHFSPLPVDTAIAVSYSLNEGVSYTSLTPTVSGSGQSSAAIDIAARAQSLGLKLTLASAGSHAATPTVAIVQIQGHLLGKADTMLILPVDCGEKVADLKGRTIMRQGEGQALAAALEQLAQQRVRVQDVDWAQTGLTETFELIQVDRRPQPGVVYDRSKGRADLREVVILTLRKALT